MAIWQKDNNKSNYRPPDRKFFKELTRDRGAVPSIISANCECKGNIKTDGEIQIDGTLNGNVTAKQVVIGESGKIRGNVTTGFLRICGKIEGDTRADTIEVTASASIKGNIFKKTISIEHGSKVVGNINELESATAKILKLQRPDVKEEKKKKN